MPLTVDIHDALDLKKLPVPPAMHILKIDAEDYTEAENSLEKVLAVNPDHLEARKKLVDFYSWVDKPARSVEQIEYVLKREPDNQELMEKLANRYARTNRQKEAEAIYQKIAAALGV